MKALNNAKVTADYFRTRIKAYFHLSFSFTFASKYRRPIIDKKAIEIRAITLKLFRNYEPSFRFDMERGKETGDS